MLTTALNRSPYSLDACVPYQNKDSQNMYIKKHKNKNKLRYLFRLLWVIENVKTRHQFPPSNLAFCLSWSYIIHSLKYSLILINECDFLIFFRNEAFLRTWLSFNHSQSLKLTHSHYKTLVSYTLIRLLLKSLHWNIFYSILEKILTVRP